MQHASDSFSYSCAGADLRGVPRSCRLKQGSQPNAPHMAGGALIRLSRMRAPPARPIRSRGSDVGTLTAELRSGDLRGRSARLGFPASGGFWLLRARNKQHLLEKRRSIARALIRWGRRNARTYPWREELPLWQALIAEVMLQRTRAAQVVPTFDEFRVRYPSPAALGEATSDELEGLVEPLGLHWRARLLHRLAREISQLDGVLPLEQPALEALPGVGPYVAGATLSLHANRRAVLIDSNFVRVLCRLVGSPFDGETRRKRWLWDLAEALTPPRAHRAYNYAVLDLAALVCLPRTPRCSKCPVLKWCVTGMEGKVGDG